MSPGISERIPHDIKIVQVNSLIPCPVRAISPTRFFDSMTTAIASIKTKRMITITMMLMITMKKIIRKFNQKFRIEPPRRILEPINN
jgi:hypothetical protein